MALAAALRTHCTRGEGLCYKAGPRRTARPDTLERKPITGGSNHGAFGKRFTRTHPVRIRGAARRRAELPQPAGAHHRAVRCRRPRGHLRALSRAALLGGSLFCRVCTDHLDVLLPQLLRSLGYPGELLPGSLLRSPSLQHLRMTQCSLQSIRCRIAAQFDPFLCSWLSRLMRLRCATGSDRQLPTHSGHC